MQIIVGLGNPGNQYLLNRHNAGFLSLDFILKDLQPINCASKFNAKICEIHNPEKTFFVYPQTFMNSSGVAIKELLSFYKLTPKDILVIHDEVDLPLGVIKFTEGSGHAGHNGVRSLIDELGTNQFRRIRVGVETRAEKMVPPTEAFVLQDFTADELRELPLEQIKSRVLLELKPKV
ncbi:MAG: aminoacyl-tRNA hydrolase [Candidatus Doudnabacteria bacterium]